MKAHRRVALFMLLLPAVVPAIALGQSGKTAPVSERSLLTLIEVGIPEQTIASKLQESGVAFDVDDAVLDRLKQAGASQAVLEAVRKAGQESKPPGSGPAITYEHVLTLLDVGIAEEAILNRLAGSPTLFTLDAKQVEELQGKGASEKLIQAMRGQQRGTAAGTTSQAQEISDLALILDCSGSMKETTPDGQTKMQAAKEVLTDLVRKIPQALHVSFIIYGHDKQQGCEAVKVVRPLSKLDDAGKQELMHYIGRLQPVANTPIALSLEAASKQLADVQGSAGVVLITDGKETCHGDPSAAAARLAENPNLVFGVDVVGLGLGAEARTAAKVIAKAGKGKYYDAQTAEQVAAVFPDVAPNLPDAEPAVVYKKSPVSSITVKPLNIKAVPKVALVAVYEHGETGVYSDHRYAVQTSKDLTKPLVVGAGKYDVYYLPAGGSKLTTLRIGVEISAGQSVELDLNKLFAAIVVPDPEIQGVTLQKLDVYKHGETSVYSDGRYAVQSTDRFGKPMMVLADQKYDVYLKPEGGQLVKIVEKVLAKAGEVTVVGGVE